MSVPDRILIERIEDYYTHFIGKYEGGQFMGFVTATIPPVLPKDDWRSQKRWYAVLHLFDSSGTHKKTETWFAGTTADGEGLVTKRAQKRLEEMLALLGSIQFGDVAIKLFSVQVDGQVFGLVDASEPEEECEAIDLLPNDLRFYSPWEGRYDT